MPIEVRCPCGTFLRAPESLVGKKARCPACKTVLLIAGTASPGGVAPAHAPSTGPRQRTRPMRSSSAAPKSKLPVVPLVIALVALLAVGGVAVHMLVLRGDDGAPEGDPTTSEGASKVVAAAKPSTAPGSAGAKPRAAKQPAAKRPAAKRPPSTPARPPVVKAPPPRPRKTAATRLPAAGDDRAQWIKGHIGEIARQALQEEEEREWKPPAVRKFRKWVVVEARAVATGGYSRYAFLVTFEGRQRPKVWAAYVFMDGSYGLFNKVGGADVPDELDLKPGGDS
jgi:hypothetical protein